MTFYRVSSRPQAWEADNHISLEQLALSSLLIISICQRSLLHKIEGNRGKSKLLEMPFNLVEKTRGIITPLWKQPTQI
jgi:hypothetical protein